MPAYSHAFAAHAHRPCLFYLWKGPERNPHVPLPSPARHAGANGCPSGWLPAIGTVYDSWPKASSSECSAFNGCTWAGQFALINGGSPPNCLRGAQPLQAPNGGSSTVACRFPEATVRSMNIASTWEFDGSGMKNTRLRVSIPCSFAV